MGDFSASWVSPQEVSAGGSVASPFHSRVSSLVGLTGTAEWSVFPRPHGMAVSGQTTSYVVPRAPRESVPGDLGGNYTTS